MYHFLIKGTLCDVFYRSDDILFRVCVSYIWELGLILQYPGAEGSLNLIGMTELGGSTNVVKFCVFLLSENFFVISKYRSPPAAYLEKSIKVTELSV